jgi:broad specificity phosphatase PhoE/HPt (histidine-containing phosphotransfer) domain-containing protein
MKPNVPKVWLIRHGESAANAGLPTENHADIVLTARGIEQAREAAGRVDRQPDLIVTSRYLRARDSAIPIRTRWPAAPVEIWPIEEFTYLSPERCRNTTPEIRRPWAAAYWERADPHYVDGPGAESFAQFMQRLHGFRARLLQHTGGFVVCVGHGQFFRACLWADPHYAVSPQAMRDWRAAEVARPMRNGEIIEWTLTNDASATSLAPTRLLDVSRALAFLDGDADVLQQLLAAFMTDAPRELQAFKTALEPGSEGKPSAMPELLKYLHRLVPTLAIIATEALHHEASTLYEALRETSSPDPMQLQRAHRLAQHLDAFLAEVRARINGMAGGTGDQLSR